MTLEDNNDYLATNLDILSDMECGETYTQETCDAYFSNMVYLSKSLDDIEITDS